MSICSHLFRPCRAAIVASAALVLAAVPAAAGPHILIDVDSGRVIAESDAGNPWYPASVTKLMTTYLAFQAMRERRLTPNSLLKVSATAMAQPPSKMGFKAGTQVTLDNAIKMLMVRSANDIAVVVAEGVGGSLPRFIEQMNATAARLGMSGTHFVNPHGLPDERQVTTARDMAILAQAIIKEFPEYELYFRMPSIRIGKRLLRNHNRLIDRYPGADGMKTGFICSSGFNLVASARRDGRRLIAVVFGAYSSTQRAEDAAKLLERGFSKTAELAALFRIGPLVGEVKNVAVDPIDLRDTMCNPNRKRPAAESDIDEDDPESLVRDRQSLLVELPPSMSPIRVFTGPAPAMPPIQAMTPTGMARGSVPLPPLRPKLP